MSKATKEVIMMGYLEKKSPKSVLGRHAWQMRYFELVLLSSPERGHEITMYYYKSDADSDHREPLGEIVLNDIMSVTVLKDKPDRFDVQVPSRVFALKCNNPKELRKWVASLQQLSAINDYQKPSHLPDSPAETMKLLAQSSLSNPDAKPSTLFSDASSAIDLISKGSAFLKYSYEHVTEQTNREIVLVFYKKDATSLGSLYFCEPGEKTEDVSTALALHTLTDMYLGKQSKAFRSSIAKNATADRCFTAVGANRAGQPTEFNLEGDSKEQVAAWLFALNAILTHKGGRKVMTAEDSAKEEEAKKKAAQAKRDAKEAEEKRLRAEQAQQEIQRRATLEAEQAAAKAAATASTPAATSIPVDDEVVSFVGFDSDDEEQQDEDAPPPAVAPAAPVAAAPVAELAATPAAAVAEPEPAPVAVDVPAAAEPTPAAAESEPTQAAEPVKAEEPAAPAAIEPAPVAASVPEPAAAPSTAESSSSPTPAAAAAAPLAGDPEVLEWLGSLGDAYPGEYGRLFQSNGVDLHFLVDLTEKDLQELGVKNGLHIKKMLAGMEKLRETGKYGKQSKQPEPVPQREPSPEPVAAPVAAPAAVEEEPAQPVAPIDPSTLGEVGKFLYKLGPAFLSYLKAFELNGVDMNFLQTLQDDDLEELGVTKLHRKKVLQELKDIRAEKAAAARAAAPSAPEVGSSSSAPRLEQNNASAVVGGYLARAQANKAAAASSGGGGSSGNMDAILASIQEAKRKKAELAAAGGGAPGHHPGHQPSTDGIDLAGTSIAAIAARMAAQREAREKERLAAKEAAAATPAP